MKTSSIVLLVFCLYLLLQACFSGYSLWKAKQISKVSFGGEYSLGDPKNPSFSLYLAGDSVGAGVGSSSPSTSVGMRVASEFSKEKFVTYTNNATSGFRMRDVLLSPPPSAKQDLIVLIVSSNDLFHFTPKDRFREEVRATLSKYSPLGSQVVIVGPGRVDETFAIPLFLRPLYFFEGKKYSRIVSEEVKAFPNTVHITPFFPPENLPHYGYMHASDNFHPNDEGHLFWKDLVMSGVRK